MTVIRPFKGVRPSKEAASSIAALPYDVYNRTEAKKVVEQNPLSFLKIDRAETQFPDDTDMYSQAVYEKARDTLQEMISDGLFVRDETNCYYLYALTLHGRTQTGLVGCASIDDYISGVIRKHENTREDKELDRIRHVDTLSAQTGPIFLAYRAVPELNQWIASVKEADTLYDFTSEDGIRHQVWKIAQPDIIEQISRIFSEIQHIYIADGHHRAASAVKTGLKRRAEYPDYTGEEEFNFFLSVLFPAEELRIYDYNRVVSGLNGYTPDTLFEEIRKKFSVSAVQLPESIQENVIAVNPESSPKNASDILDAESRSHWHPEHKGEIGLYINGSWYKLTASPTLYCQDPVEDLDVSILQNEILAPLLGIQNPKTDSRIQFIGGIRGLRELERLVDADTTGNTIAFAMYPTSMEELLAVADSGELMPPKSTWFEPKLRSGLFIHEFEENI